jgi:glycosyltransferase involved in cell wall biosynthesis
MKILYVATHDNPLDLNAGSGSDYQIYQALLRNGAEIKLIGPFKDSPSLFEKTYRKAHRLFSKRRFAKYSVAYLRQIGRAVDEAAASYKPDVVFTINTVSMAYCQNQYPLACRLDTSLKGSHDQWPIFSEFEYRRMLTWEKSSITRSRLLITYSEWSAGVLQEYYRIPRENILVIPDPASLPAEVVPQQMDFYPKTMSPLHLLLVGREFDRKGIDIAIRTVELLNESGVPAELRIVGLKKEDGPHVRFMGLFNKTVESQLKEYVEQYKWAHFLLHPSRFDPGGIVASEAAAFGVPAITNTGGGMATTVKHEVSGYVLSRNSPAERYAAVIKKAMANPAEYIELRRTTRQRYDAELNWNVSGKLLFQSIQKIVDG